VEEAVEFRQMPDLASLDRHVDACRRLILDRLDRGRDEPPATRREIDTLLALSSSDAGPLSPVSPTRLPACDFLPDALALGDLGPEADIARALSAIAPALHWTYSYPDDPRLNGLASAIAFTQIIGRQGLKRDNGLLLGLTLMAPHTIYPLHAHPAVEFYLVIAGTALWQAGHEPAMARPPGSLIFHPSGVAHAMTTAAEPLLAVFTWHGDIMSPSVYLT